MVTKDLNLASARGALRRGAWALGLLLGACEDSTPPAALDMLSPRPVSLHVTVDLDGWDDVSALLLTGSVGGEVLLGPQREVTDQLRSFWVQLTPPALPTAGAPLELQVLGLRRADRCTRARGAVGYTLRPGEAQVELAVSLAQPYAWDAVSPTPVLGRDINDVKDVDGRRAWLVGRGGLAMTTGDGGATFCRVDSGTVEDLTAVHSLDGQRVLLTGATHVYLSSDGGLSFKASASPPAPLRRCALLRGGDALCETADRILRYDLTLDRFEAVASAGLVRPGGASAVAVAPGATSVVLRSADARGAFTAVGQVPAQVTSLWAAPDDQQIVVTSNAGGIYRSADAGKTFTAVAQSADYSALRDLSVSGLDNQHVYFVGSKKVGVEVGVTMWVLRGSSDGGQSLTEQNSAFFLDDIPPQVSFGSVQHGFLWSGHLLVTSQGVGGFAQVDRAPLDPTTDNRHRLRTLEEVVFPTATVGFVSNSWFSLVASGNPFSQLYITRDAGATFQQVYDSPGPGRLALLRAPDAAHVFVTSSDPFGVSFKTLLRSSDGGATFASATIAPGSDIRDLAFASASTGLAALSGGMAPGVYRTTDGAATWKLLSLPAGCAPTALIFSDPSHALITCAEPALLTSADGGQTFTLKATGGAVLTSPAFARGPVGWAVAGAALRKTTDHGQTWTAQSYVGSDGAGGNVVEIAVSTPERATARLANGSLVGTTDGGATLWRPRVAPPDGVVRLHRLPDGLTTYATTRYALYRSRAP